MQDFLFFLEKMYIFLIKNAKIIIADEPTGNLDSENTIEVMKEE